MILLFDSCQLLHRAQYVSGLSYQGQDTEIIYGVLAQTYKLVKQFKPDKFIFCWDSKKSKRKEINKEYKADRKKDPKVYTSMWQQESQLKEIIPQLGWNQWEEEGYEADDLIACIIKQSKKEEIIIISSDSDLYQLLKWNVSQYLINKKEMFSYVKFKEIYDISPSDWDLVKAIGGCSSDNIKGIPGIGKVKALDIVTNGVKSVNFKAFEKNENLVADYLRLTSLPFDYLPVPKLKDLQLNKDYFIEICQLFGFKSFLSNLRGWKEVFKG